LTRKVDKTAIRCVPAGNMSEITMSNTQHRKLDMRAYEKT
jgi:hypothetical protein